MNPFVYSENNPINAFDPDGLKLRLAGNTNEIALLLGFLSDISGANLKIDSDNNISGDFCGSEDFSNMQAWLKEIIDSENLLTVQFGPTTFGGYFRNGNVYIDSVFKTPNQKKYEYTGKPLLEYGFLMGESHPFKAQGVLAHELFGHGLDWVRGGPANPYGISKGTRRKLERTAIGRANEVRTILGYPLRYR
jgi:hypothetical protein